MTNSETDRTDTDNRRNFQLDTDLRGYLKTNSDVVTVISKPVSERLVGALSAKSEKPILFENIVERPGYSVLDILLKHRNLQARALGVTEDEYLNAGVSAKAASARIQDG